MSDSERKILNKQKGKRGKNGNPLAQSRYREGRERHWRLCLTAL